MDIKYTIDLERGIVISKSDGPTTFADFMDLLDRLRRDPDFDPSFDHLADYAEGGPSNLSSDEMRRLPELSIFRPMAKRALVVRPGLQYGLARMYQVMAEQNHPNIRLFRSREEALRWLEDENE